jgi:hypothetical protein
VRRTARQLAAYHAHGQRPKNQPAACHRTRGATPTVRLIRRLRAYRPILKRPFHWKTLNLAHPPLEPLSASLFGGGAARLLLALARSSTPATSGAGSAYTPCPFHLPPAVPQPVAEGDTQRRPSAPLAPLPACAITSRVNVSPSTGSVAALLCRRRAAIAQQLLQQRPVRLLPRRDCVLPPTPRLADARRLEKNKCGQGGGTTLPASPRASVGGDLNFFAFSLL